MNDLLNVREVCVFFGGAERPIHRVTLSRGIADGRFPKPIQIGVRTRRWLRSDCEAALAKLAIDAKQNKGE
jgi:predicted DNA-binding transcriptional regulator AlpA